MAEILRVLSAAVFAIGCGWLAASLIPLYDLVARGVDTGSGARYLPLAHGVAWTGIALSAVAAGIQLAERLRARRPIGWTPLVAVPLIVESWLVGLLVALVLVSI